MRCRDVGAGLTASNASVFGKRMSQPPGAASRLAAARLERAQIRADAARKTPMSTNASAYGSYWSAPGGSPAAGSPAAGEAPSVVRNISGAPAGEPPAAGSADAQKHMAEIGVPIVRPGSSEAFAVLSKEGALHENHDQGAAVILPNKTVLFACLDGHGAEGASVSGYALRNLLSGATAALEAGKSASDAVNFAFVRTSATMQQHVPDCRFSGSTAILMILHQTEKGPTLHPGSPERRTPRSTIAATHTPAPCADAVAAHTAARTRPRRRRRAAIECHACSA